MNLLLLWSFALAQAQPRTLIRNAEIVTMGETPPRASAMVIEDGKILGLGTETELASFAPFQEILDVQGHTITPSYHDNHTHPIDSGVEFEDCYLYDANTLTELFSMLKICDATLSPNQTWLRGSGWSIYLFDKGQSPSLKMLDDLNLKHPVALLSSDGHSYWVNSLALTLAHVNSATPGLDDRSLTGVFYEDAMSWIEAVLPKRTLEESLRGLKRAVDEMHQYGITSFKDAYTTEEHLKVYTEFTKSEPAVDISVSLYAEPSFGVDQIRDFVRLRKKYSSEKLQIRTIKIFLDGVIEDHTAALLEPYVDGTRGVKMHWRSKALKRFAIEAERAGFQLHFHAIGDAAVRLALDAIAVAQRVNHSPYTRHEIAHAQLIHPEDWIRFKTLGVSAVFSPLWAQRDEPVRDYSEPLIGSERTNYMYPIGAIHRSGGRLAFGSDWSVTSMNPWEGIFTALTRPDEISGETWLPEQTIDLMTALHGYTSEGARAVFKETSYGTLSVGKAAHFVILDRNPFEINPKDLGTVRVKATYYRGIKVFDSL